jgi:hypothetical protein
MINNWGKIGGPKNIKIAVWVRKIPVVEGGRIKTDPHQIDFLGFIL